MLTRCYDKKHKQWKDYGGRGIVVCARWKNNFEAFYDDMADTHQIGLTIERKNNDRGYYKANCSTWITRALQNQNRRNNVVIRTPWGKLCVAEAARRAQMKSGTIYARIKADWPKKYLFIPEGAKPVFWP